MKYITKTFTYKGKRIYVRGKTEREVTEKIVEKRLELEHKKTVVTSELNTNEWFEIYMRTYKVNITDNTRRDYVSLYNNIIRPYIGPLKIASVTPITCQSIINSIADKSSSYINKTAILLRSMFEKALQNELIIKDPTINLIIPKGTSGKRRALTEAERLVFLKVCDNDRPASLYCKIIYYCGLRPSEVARIAGGDYDSKKLHVRGTKTASSDRYVPIPSALKLPKLKRGELLFKKSPGTMYDKKKIELLWLEVIKKMNQEIETPGLTMYCLRHDYCTRLEEAGVMIDVARRLMGHSSVEVTSRIYTHASEVSFNNASKLIEKYNKNI